MDISTLPEIGCDPAHDELQPALRWEAERLKYVVEIQAYPEELSVLKDGLPTAEVWLRDEAQKIFVGRVSNFRSADLKDGRTGVIVCDMACDQVAWQEGWKEHGRLRAWAQKSVRRLRARDFDLLGPVEEVAYAR